jgi:hypothetical protein
MMAIGRAMQLNLAARDNYQGREKEEGYVFPGSVSSQQTREQNAYRR